MWISHFTGNRRGELRLETLRPSAGIRWARAASCLAIMTAIAGMPFAGQQQQPPPLTPHPILLPEANRPLDPNQQMEMRERNEKHVSFEAANAVRKKQIDEDTAKLLLFAKDLKAAMDKASDGKISERMIREAEVIELLARNVQTRMKLTVGGK